VEIDKIKESHHQLSGVSLEDLRNRIEEKDEIFAKELELLKDVLAVKSREVDETIMDKKRIVGGYETELDELRAVVNSLQDKLHES
jgi:DNA mismatch repair ATPase MutS